MSSNNVISGSVVLTPIAAVDTSTASSGVTMYSLVFASSMLNNANIIQFEYWVANSSSPLVAVNHGFLPLESAVTTQGISNQITLAIPSGNNDFDPAGDLQAKVRVYFGQTVASGASVPEIVVSNWSNDCPIHNPPPQPEQVRAFIVAGEVGPSYIYDDQLYVQIYDNPAYDSVGISFIVSYNYMDASGNNQWNVTAPITSWTEHTFDDPSFNAILLAPITLPTDAMSNISVTVNAVYSYAFSSNQYFSVSEVSNSVIAVPPTITDPTLNTITKSDYSVYENGNSSQEISISWIPPQTSVLPNFSVASYDIVVNNVVVANVNSSVTQYTYTVDSMYLLPTASSTTALVFKVVAIGETGSRFESNTSSINTFLYATEPRSLAVAWANSGNSSGGDGVDIALDFINPLSVGYGTPTNFTIQVRNNVGVVVYTATEAYNAATTVYPVFLNNVPSTAGGSVTVWLNTTDTNSSDNEEGATSTVGYTVSDAPFITDVFYNGAIATFVVVSNTLLVEMNLFTYQATAGSQLVFVPFTSVVGNHGNYTVSMTVLSTGDYRYVFEFDLGSYPANPAVASMSVANSVAISSVDLKFI